MDSGGSQCQFDPDLGGGVIKQRIARPDQGESKGCRTIIPCRRAAKAFFVYGFSKSVRANIGTPKQPPPEGGGVGWRLKVAGRG